MKFELYERIESMEIKKQIVCLLKKCSKEFIPPLECRNSPTQINFSATKTNSNSYFSEVLKCHFILAFDGLQVIGLVGFIDNYKISDALATYISIIAVASEYRKQGVAKTLLTKLLFDFQNCHHGRIVVRSWSSNNASQALLESLGFTKFKTIKNHRAGGIDTIYYQYES